MITTTKGTAISDVHVRTPLVITLEAAPICSSVRFFVRGLERMVASISQSKSTILKYQNVTTDRDQHRDQQREQEARPRFDFAYRTLGIQ